MRYALLFLLLTGCAYNATLIPTGGGQSLTGTFNHGPETMEVIFEGQPYRGDMIRGSTAGVAMSGLKQALVYGVSNAYTGILIGPKGTVNCSFQLGGTGGAGACRTPDGRDYDLILKMN